MLMYLAWFSLLSITRCTPSWFKVRICPLVGIHPGNWLVDLVGFIIPRGDESHVELLDPIPVIIHKVFQCGFHIIMTVFQGVKRDQRVDVRLSFHGRIQLLRWRRHYAEAAGRAHPSPSSGQAASTSMTTGPILASRRLILPDGRNRGKEGEGLIPVVGFPTGQLCPSGQPGYR